MTLTRAGTSSKEVWRNGRWEGFMAPMGAVEAVLGRERRYANRELVVIEKGAEQVGLKDRLLSSLVTTILVAYLGVAGVVVTATLANYAWRVVQAVAH